jgi:hypothetical protein
MAAFIDCGSLSINYDIMGIATVSYTVVHDYPGFVIYNSISAGGQRFRGHVINASTNPIIGTSGWYETHATLLATTN